MNPTPSIPSSLQLCVTYYSAGATEKFGRIGFDAAKEAAEACSAWSLQTELARYGSGEYPRKVIPHFGEVSLVQAVAIMSAFLVWSSDGQKLPSSQLLQAASLGRRLHK